MEQFVDCDISIFYLTQVEQFVELLHIQFLPDAGGAVCRIVRYQSIFLPDAGGAVWSDEGGNDQASREAAVPDQSALPPGGCVVHRLPHRLHHWAEAGLSAVHCHGELCRTSLLSE